MSKKKTNFSELSITITKQLKREIKKNQGIFFTPQSIINKNINIISKIKNLGIQNILEPSCGTGEYIHKLHSKFPSANITGIELNNTIFEQIKYLNTTGNIQIYNEDYLKWSTDVKYDLIIGNPPYFVMKKGNIDEKYFDFFDGRPNIFVMFICDSLLKLQKNGVLSFILPKNFLNCLYYNKLRKHIINNYKIIDIVECSDDSYIETQQDTIMFIIQNKKPTKANNKFIYKVGEYTTFNTKSNVKQLYTLSKSSTTLGALGFDVKVGNVVWNQCKSELTDDTNDTRLIYNSDIKNNALGMKQYKNPTKKNYITKEGKTGPMLVLNRGYGKGSYKFDYCIIDISNPYLIENHLICIIYKSTTANNDNEAKYNDISNELLIHKYNDIIQSWNNEKTQKFVKLYFGNNAINTTELKYVVPMFMT
jgi:tRNA1(Val) A37 N6-methylase TrmN6